MRRFKIAVGRRVNKIYADLFKKDFVTGHNVIKIPVEYLGSENAGWVIPSNVLNKESICYCAGVGEDISFDLDVIDKYGCDIESFDPTPRAKAHVAKVAANNPQYHYFDIGLWDSEEVLKFYAPENENHVSHSALNLQKTEKYFEAKCKRLSQIMSENNHDEINLLKIDIEGAEYKVLESLIEDKLVVDIICVEYDEMYFSMDKNYKNRISSSVESLVAFGYELAYVDGIGNYTFIHSRCL